MVAGQLTQKMSIVANVFALLGVVLGVVALSTNYWTEETISLSLSQLVEMSHGTNFTAGRIDHVWNGVIFSCSTSRNDKCVYRLMKIPLSFIILGLLFLLVGNVFLCWDLLKVDPRRSPLSPMFVFVASVLMTLGLCDYGSSARLNSHSSRTMIASILFTVSALLVSAFVAGRYFNAERLVITSRDNNQQTSLPTSTNEL